MTQQPESDPRTYIVLPFNMAPKSPRPRSNTSVSTSASTMSRPKSRQSTTSVHSIATHQAHLYHQTSEPIFQVQQQPPMIHHATPEEKVAQQLSQSNSGYAIDPTLQYDHNQAQPAHNITDNSGVVDSPDLQNNFNDSRASVPPGRQKESTPQEDIIGDGDKRKKGSSSSQANDIELRRLYRENQGRDLHEVALQVIRDDKGPKSEKSKQIFGMLWYVDRCNLPRLDSSYPGCRLIVNVRQVVFLETECSLLMRQDAELSSCHPSTQLPLENSFASYSQVYRLVD